MTESAHAGKTIRCPGHDDDEQYCDTELTFPENGRFVSSPQAKEPRERFQSSALRFDCPECGNTVWVCPICSEPDDSDDNSPGGWFRGEDTGEQIPCHNCNQREIQERRRHHGHAGKMGSRNRRRGNGDEDLPPEAFL